MGCCQAIETELQRAKSCGFPMMNGPSEQTSMVHRSGSPTQSFVNHAFPAEKQAPTPLGVPRNHEQKAEHHAFAGLAVVRVRVYANSIGSCRPCHPTKRNRNARGIQEAFNRDARGPKQERTHCSRKIDVQTPTCPLEQRTKYVPFAQRTEHPCRNCFAA